MVYSQTRICPRKLDTEILLDFEIQTDHSISAKKPDLVLIIKTKRTCDLVYFAVPPDHKTKMKESENTWNSPVN